MTQPVSSVAPSAAAAWASNSTPREIADRLLGASRVLVFTHMKPDGDAAGSALALVRALNLTPGCTAQACFAGPLPPWLPAMAGDTPVRQWERDGPPDFDAGACVIVDTGAWSQLESFKSYLVPRAARTTIIDHHRRGDADAAAHRWIDSEAAAVCQPVAELCTLLLGSTVDRLPSPVATALYLGLATDTGWFRHSNVTPKVFRLAADLVAAGANPAWLYQTVEQQDTLSRLHLMSRALASLELIDAGRVGVITLTRRDFEETGCPTSESGGFIDLPQTIASVKVAAVITEGDPVEFGLAAGTALTKISLRSKTDDVDVDLICRTMGGGGHKRAAGAKVRMGLAETRSKVIAAITAVTAGLSGTSNAKGPT